MPSMSAHMAVACNLSNKLIFINKEDFIKGNLLPDLFDDKNKSHFKIKGKKYYIPDIEKAVQSIDINNSMYLGYLTHLLLDKYYFDEYLIKYNNDLFKDNLLYKDYDILNKFIINYFKIDVDYLNKILINFPKEINNNKLSNNINCLNLNIDGKLSILDKDDFIEFLDRISIRIYNDLINIIKTI